MASAKRRKIALFRSFNKSFGSYTVSYVRQLLPQKGINSLVDNAGNGIEKKQIKITMSHILVIC